MGCGADRLVSTGPACSSIQLKRRRRDAASSAILQPEVSADAENSDAITGCWPRKGRRFHGQGLHFVVQAFRHSSLPRARTQGRRHCLDRQELKLTSSFTGLFHVYASSAGPSAHLAQAFQCPETCLTMGTYACSLHHIRYLTVP